MLEKFETEKLDGTRPHAAGTLRRVIAWVVRSVCVAALLAGIRVHSSAQVSQSWDSSSSLPAGWIFWPGYSIALAGSSAPNALRSPVVPSNAWCLSPLMGDGQVSTLFRFTSGGELINASVLARSSSTDALSVLTCYRAYVFGGTQQPGIKVVKYVNGAGIQLGGPVPVTALAYNHWYLLQLTVTGRQTTTLECRVIDPANGASLNASGAWSARAASCIATADTSGLFGSAYSYWGIRLSNTPDAGPVLADDFKLVNLNAGIVPPTNASWFASPYNTWLDGQTLVMGNSGAYFKFDFTGSSAALLFDTAGYAGLSVVPRIKYSVDGQAYVGPIPVTATIPLAVAPRARHTLLVWYATSTSTDDNWLTPANVVRCLGVQLDFGAAISPPVILPGRVLFYGDSITRGAANLSTKPGQATIDTTDSQQAWPVALSAALNSEFGIVGWGGQGWLAAGAGFVPPFTQAWDKHCARRSRLVNGRLSPTPDRIVINHGTNDTQDFRAAVPPMLAALRAAAPSARINVLVPFGRYGCSPLQAGVAAYLQQSADPITCLLDGGATLAEGLSGSGNQPTLHSRDGVHPNVIASARIAAVLARILP